MTLDLTCRACDTSFELDVSELLDEPKLQCPSCDARAPVALAEGLSAALEDLFAQLARARKKFALALELESDDLPPPFDRERTAAPDEEEEEEDVEESDDDDEER